MNFLRSPLTWLILIAGIFLNYEFNIFQWRAAGVGYMTPEQATTAIDQLAPANGFWQALIGSVIVVAIVVGLAILRGERLERDDGSGPGHLVLGVVLCVPVFLIGFLLIPPLLDRISPRQETRYAVERPAARKEAQRRSVKQREIQYGGFQ